MPILKAWPRSPTFFAHKIFLSATVVTVRKTGNGQPMTPLRDFWRSLAHFWKVSIKGRDHFWKLHSHLFTRKLVSRIVISKNAKIAIAMALALNRCIFRYRLVCLKLYSTFLGWPSVDWPVDSLFFSSIGLITTVLAIFSPTLFLIEIGWSQYSTFRNRWSVIWQTLCSLIILEINSLTYDD